MEVENQTLGRPMIRLFMGCVPTRVIYVAAKLGFIDHIGPPNEQSRAHLFDMTFLVIVHGRLRTADEYSGLLSQTGFRLQRVVPTESESRSWKLS